MSLPSFGGLMYIDGKWCQADSGRLIDVTNPATEEVLCQVAYGGAAETKRAPFGWATAWTRA